MVIMNRETIFLSAAPRQLLVRLAFAPVYQRAQPQTHPSIIQIRFDMQKSELQAISMQSRQENTIHGFNFLELKKLGFSLLTKTKSC